MRILLLAFVLLLLAPLRAGAQIIDRIAALVDGQVIALSEIDQMVITRIHVPRSGESEDDFRRRVLDSMIAQALRRRDVERFGAPQVSPERIETRYEAVRARFASEEEFLDALARAEMTDEELRAILRRQVEVEAYIDERFAPQIFISLAEIGRFYRDVYVPQRQERGLAPVSLDQAREEIRGIMRGERLEGELELWTRQLREQANVDIYTW